MSSHASPFAGLSDAELACPYCDRYVGSCISSGGSGAAAITARVAAIFSP